MRLSKIKLAGFKSFVDPTTITLSSNLTGIVGPNGCGKSNVIDAVRWVMGESSAKHLRGSSMEDVIFNGSSSRKPIGMATVELIFDNSAGKLEGQFAEYAEISVKRVITRDGYSKYSLNGTRCRRRDVADLFLGTGLGPRSYAIIEQGMISRLIEAKPEELRFFLEEAAGISKYKERRRETENRIRHTRDNLDRLDDLCEEIDKQLSHLKRQSRSAERYKKLKQEERQYKAEHLALRWRELKVDLDVRDSQISETDTKLQQAIAEQRAVESKIEDHRRQHTEANDELNKVQGQYYSLGSDITRVEQNIKHQNDLQQRQETDVQQIETSLAEIRLTLQTDKDAIDGIRQQLETEKPDLETLKNSEAQLDQDFQTSENAMQDWQHGWDEVNRQYSEASQKAQVEKSRIEQIERHIEQLKHRLERINVEQLALRGEDIDEQIKDLETNLKGTDKEKENLEQDLTAASTLIGETRENIVGDEKKSSENRRKINDCQGRLSSLEALQQSALGKTDDSVTKWLDHNGLSKQARLAQKIKVDSGWEKAVETVLGDSLEAVCVDDIEQLCQSLSELSESNISLVESSASNSVNSASGLLQEKVKSSIQLGQFFNGIKIAKSLKKALSMRKSLSDGESVITSDGLWLGKNWLRICNDHHAKRGVLARETEIRSLQSILDDLEKTSVGIDDGLKSLRETLQLQESQREEAQAALNTIHARINELQAQISARESRQDHISSRGQNLAEELNEIEQLIDNENIDIENATKLRKESLESMEELDNERDRLESKRDTLREELQKNRHALQDQRDASQQLAINIEGLNTRKESLIQNIERMEKTCEQQEQKMQELKSSLEISSLPIEEFKLKLKDLLEQRLATEKMLDDARNAVDAITELLKSFEQSRSGYEQNASNTREQLENIKMDSQEIRVRTKTTLEQLEETGFEAEPLIAQLDDTATSKAWAEKVGVLSQRLNRLGPINLAAIDEYQEQLKRKEHLDEQHSDITLALKILETAIAKIDKETRTRFKETFDHVNNRINDMFPKLFGGGSAHLEMTGDDLLNTGVAIMARPPGKRISNIHLLSGGEKALTSIALIFAIFELNPAPFCMLDEVDAPLDEANVGRFCQLLKDMSHSIQFIFITHNKSSMEISEQLNGVTMREAGVSRMVSVDIAEAATMAAV